MTSLAHPAPGQFLIGFFVRIYQYREYLSQSVARDLKTKYKRSVLGYFWTMLHPLAMMSIIAVVFSHIIRMNIEDYAVFLFCGLLPWNYFNSTCMMSLHSIKSNAKLFGQIPVPKYVFVLSVAMSNLVNLLLALVPLLLVMAVAGRWVQWPVLLFPVVLVPIFCVTIGISLILSTANVFFDDTQHLAEVGFQGLYFLSPVLYHRDLLPDWLVQYLVYNPMFLQIEFMRDIFYEGVVPNPALFGVNLLGSLAVLALGLWVFERNEGKFLYFV